MATTGTFAFAVICVLAYLGSCVAEEECPTKSRVKMDLCVATFSTANLGNQNERKERISNNNMACPTDILKDSCTSFNVLINCVNLAGFPEGCEMEFDKELKNQDFQCTYMELAKICPDAEKLGASSIMVSVSLLAVSLLFAVFHRL